MLLKIGKQNSKICFNLPTKRYKQPLKRNLVNVSPTTKTLGMAVASFANLS